MKNSFLKQSWIVFKIWIIALSLNTLIGAFYLVGDLPKKLMLAGFTYGAIFSLPIVIILLIVINHCVVRRKNGFDLFHYVFLFGLCLTFVSSMFFLALMQWAPGGLMVISMVAAIIAIGSQYHPLFRLANYEDEFQNYPS